MWRRARLLPDTGRGEPHGGRQGRPQLIFFQGRAIGGGRGQWLGGTMASAEHEPITGVWGQSPQRGPGADTLVRGQGGEAPLKLKAFWSLDVQRSRQI